MRPSNATLLILLASFCLGLLACDTNEYHYGCKIRGGQCVCSYGCPEEYIFRNRAACHSSLLGQERARSVNQCDRRPCLHGLCTTTVAEPGFACVCVGTGYYGSRCEKACPTVQMRGVGFPYECVVI